MGKKVRIAGVDDAAEETAHDAPPNEATADDGVKIDEPGGQEAGAPATEDGPSMEDLMPEIEAAFRDEDGDGNGGNDDGGNDGGATSAEESVEIDPLQEAHARIAELEAEKVEIRDRLLRALADAENTRRRADRDRKDAEAYGGTRLARDLLAVYDNLERALAAADDAIRANHGAFLEGVELTRRELENAFGKHKIQKVSPQPGEKFDPNRHQAMFEAPIPGAANGTVLEVMAPGFVIADRLLRPAMVGVARAAPQPKPEEAPVDDAQPPKGETQGD